MTDKTLGQIAYEAWISSYTYDTGIANRGTHETAEAQACWQAAAEAVVEQASGGPVGSPGAELADAIARARVIEAAMAAGPALRHMLGVTGDSGPHEMAIIVLLDELDALEAAEKEGERWTW